MLDIAADSDDSIDSEDSADSEETIDSSTLFDEENVDTKAAEELANLEIPFESRSIE